MDPPTDLADLVEDYEANIDDLADTLTPLLSSALPQTASTLPLLDKAKLYTLTAYTIESLLYNTLTASGGDAKSHPIFGELARLKGYFRKLKEAEEHVGSGGAGPKARINKEAAARFIRHGLSGNDKYDLERAERIAKEKARAAIKARQLNKKFSEEDEAQRMAEVAAEQKLMKELSGEPEPDDEEGEQDGEEADNDVDAENEDFYGTTEAPESMDVDNTASSPQPAASVAKPPTATNTKSKRKRRRDAHAATDDAPSPNTERTLRKAARRTKKLSSRLQRMNPEANSGEATKQEELVLPTPTPQAHGDTFNALLEGTFSKDKKEKDALRAKTKGRGKGKKRTS